MGENGHSNLLQSSLINHMNGHLFLSHLPLVPEISPTSSTSRATRLFWRTRKEQNKTKQDIDNLQMDPVDMTPSQLDDFVRSAIIDDPCCGFDKDELGQLEALRSQIQFKRSLGMRPVTGMELYWSFRNGGEDGIKLWRSIDTSENIGENDDQVEMTDTTTTSFSNDNTKRTRYLSFSRQSETVSISSDCSTEEWPSPRPTSCQLHRNSK